MRCVRPACRARFKSANLKRDESCAAGGVRIGRCIQHSQILYLIGLFSRSDLVGRIVAQRRQAAQPGLIAYSLERVAVFAITEPPDFLAMGRAKRPVSISAGYFLLSSSTSAVSALSSRPASRPWWARSLNNCGNSAGAPVALKVLRASSSAAA